MINIKYVKFNLICKCTHFAKRYYNNASKVDQELYFFVLGAEFYVQKKYSEIDQDIFDTFTK